MNTYIDEELQEQEPQQDAKVIPLRKPYAVWKVRGRDYKLKLDTAAICDLERQLKGNLMGVFDLGTVPPLNIMLAVVHASMRKFEHGMSLDKVKELFDDYTDDGGSQVEFMTDVMMPLYQVSGFFSGKMSEKMEKGIMTAKEEL